jgi:protein-S-isoprenylcysteine O-methyltransferase Ste14
METAFIALRALFFSVCFIWLWWWIALGVRGFDYRLNVTMPDWARSAAIIPGIAGAIIAGACIVTFIVRGQGTPAPFDAPSKFVAVGPYRYVRNPMYFGGFLLLVSLAMYEKSLSILIFCFAWLLLTHVFVLVYEEPTLERKFGESYEDYRKRVHRWLPRLPA